MILEFSSEQLEYADKPPFATFLSNSNGYECRKSLPQEFGLFWVLKIYEHFLTVAGNGIRNIFSIHRNTFLVGRIEHLRRFEALQIFYV